MQQTKAIKYSVFSVIVITSQYLLYVLFCFENNRKVVLCHWHYCYLSVYHNDRRSEFRFSFKIRKNENVSSFQKQMQSTSNVFGMFLLNL
jgi:hypothetical protein